MLSPVEQIKAKLDIASVVGGYIKLEKAGVNHRARCPFHNERTPSFFVSPSRDTFHCFGCSKGGDIFTFVEEIEGIGFKEALNLLADKAGVALSENVSAEASQTGSMRKALEAATEYFETNLAQNNVAKDYLSSRGLNDETISMFRVGVALDSWDGLLNHLKKKGHREEVLVKAGLCSVSTKNSNRTYDRFRNRIMFPISDATGRVVGFTGRVMPPAKAEAGGAENLAQEQGGKYVNSPETSLFNKSKILYGLHHAKQSIKEADKAILVEGQLDVLMAYQAGTKNVVAASGTALSSDQLRLLSRFTETLVLILDGDEAGFKASNRSVKAALMESFYVSVIPMPVGKDPADMIKESLPEWQKALSLEQSFMDYAVDTLKEQKLSRAKLAEAVKEVLYPYIEPMYNEIEKDRALNTIAGLLEASADAAKADFEKWQQTQTPQSAEKVVKGGQTSEEEAPIQIASLPDRLVMIANRLLGLLWWQEKGESSLDTKALHKSLEDLLGPKLYGYLASGQSKSKEESIFEAEAYYEGVAKLENEVAELLNALKEEVLRYKLEAMMSELRKAESAGDLKAAQECLLKCQEITNKLSELRDI